MICKTVQYKVKAGEVDKAKAAIAEFIRHIKKGEPDTLYYYSYQHSSDHHKFMHVMAFKDAAAEEKHKNSSYCKAFVDIIYPLSVEGPDFTDLEPVE